MLQGALNRKDKQRMIGGIAHFYQSNLVLGLINIGYFFIISTLSIPARLLLRKKIGERSISIASFFLSIGVYCGIYLFSLALFSTVSNSGLYGRFLGSWMENPISFSWSGFFYNFFLLLINPFIILIVFIIFRGGEHFKFHLNNHRNKVISYSFYRGQGIYFQQRLGGKIFGFSVNETILRMIVEPLAIAKSAILLLVLTITAMIFRSWHPEDITSFHWIDTLLFGALIASLSLIMSAITLFLEEFAIMQKGRDAIMDMVDGEIDMQKIMSIKESLRIENPDSKDLNLLN